MEYRSGVNIDTSRVGSGGGGGRGGMAIGGGIGGIILLVLTLLFGGNIGDLMGTGGGGQDTSVTDISGECQTSDDIQNNRECRWYVYENALHNYWSKQVQGFQDPKTQLFSGSIQTACGTGSSEMGPFYCPGDQTIYLDTTFLNQLFDQLGAQGGDAAELYVYGHEYGHHISNLTGDMKRGRAYGDQTGPKSGQVRLELQADCYAGAFMANVTKDPQSGISEINRDDLLRIANAARAVGDDHIQKQTQGRVVPESWTHGSSEMRQRWVAKGFDSGDPKVCDTFDTDDL